MVTKTKAGKKEQSRVKVKDLSKSRRELSARDMKKVKGGTQEVAKVGLGVAGGVVPGGSILTNALGGGLGAGGNVGEAQSAEKKPEEKK